MTCARFAVGAVALGATVAVALQDVIKECCTRAHAQTQTASPEPTVWDHNGSVMYLVANGSSREIYYQKPRSGMLEAGARPGSLLFRGEVNNGQYLGTAYIFNSHCGPIPYEVKGSILNDDERIVLTGQAPRVRAGLSRLRILYERFGIQAIKIKRGSSIPRTIGGCAAASYRGLKTGSTIKERW